jgi:hypothetical protein
MMLIAALGHTTAQTAISFTVLVTGRYDGHIAKARREDVFW